MENSNTMSINEDVMDEAVRQIRGLFECYQVEVDDLYLKTDSDKKMVVNFPVEFSPLDNGQVFVRAAIQWTASFKDVADGKPAGGRQLTFEEADR